MLNNKKSASFTLLAKLKSLASNSHVFLALKVALAMGSLLIAGWWLDQVSIAVTLTLGVMAGALSEVDQNPKGRLLHLLFSLCCFFIAITLITLLIDRPWIFGPLLVLGTLALILMAAWGNTKGNLGFGILLVSLYAMQGHVDSPSFWYQPLFLTLGAAWYGLLSWLILVIWPYKQVHEQLAQCYFYLARYLVEKSRFFASPPEQHQALRHQLAQVNIDLVSALEHSKRMLNRRLKGNSASPELGRLLALYLLVQEMHERAASSHYSYQQLNQELTQHPVLLGYQVLLIELGESCKKLGQAILSHQPFAHSKRISWELSALQNQIDYSHLQQHYAASLVSSMRYLSRNLTDLQQALLRGEALTQPRFLFDDRELNHPQLSEPPVKLAQVPRQAFWPKLKALLHPNALLFRHCIRLCTCFAISYGVISYFELTRGYWILLTILFVCQPSFSATRQRLVQRTLGTLGGILVAVPLVTVFPELGAQLIILLLCAWVFFTQVKVNYSWAVGFVTLFVLLAFNLQGGAGELVWHPRLVDTLLGCGLAFGAVWCIWPDWQQRHLPRLLADAMEANADYLAAIAKQFNEGRVDDLDYRLPRKQAHLADNQLALAWQHIRVEPVAKYWLSVCFDIAYRNHALLSYLSALGAHRSQNLRLLPVQTQQIQYLVQQLQASAHALRSTRALPLSAVLSLIPKLMPDEDITPLTEQQEWQYLSQQLIAQISGLVDDLYELAESFPHSGANSGSNSSADAHSPPDTATDAPSHRVR